VSRDVVFLHYHPSWTALRIDEIDIPSVFRCLGPDPIPAITTKGTLLNGFDLYEAAKRSGEQSILCLEYDLTDEQVLEWIVNTAGRQTYLNGFNRVCLAIDLVDAQLRPAAADNQRTRTAMGWTKLSEAERIHRNDRIASITGAGLTNVKRTRAILRLDSNELSAAVRTGEVSINRAYCWSKTGDPEGQLTCFRAERDARDPLQLMTKRIAAKHSVSGIPRDEPIGPDERASLLCSLTRGQLEKCEIRETQTALPVIIISSGALNILRMEREQVDNVKRKASEPSTQDHQPRQGVLGLSRTRPECAS
jgi:hypothetical protein